MQEQYANAVPQDFRGAGQIGGPTAKAIEKPTLAMQIEQLGKILGDCHNTVSKLESSVDRLIGPVPENGAKDGAAPVPDSFSGKLEEMLRYATAPSQRLGRTSQRMHSAV